jgi:hypothetical protein
LVQRLYIDTETDFRGHNTTVHVYQGVTIREIDDTVEKIKLKKFNIRKIMIWLGCGGLIAVTLGLIPEMVLDYFSHIGVDQPLFP